MQHGHFKKFVSYYKWHLIFLLLIIVCLAFIVQSCSTSTEPDLVIGYIASPYLKIEDFDNNKGQQIEILLHDANDDGDKTVELLDYTVDKEDEINELFVDMIDSKSYHIYILPKHAFEAYKDKSAFSNIEVADVNVDSLKDEDGRIYAYSIEGNSYAEKLGFINNANLYIAAANFGDAELSAQEKNGINITREIIKQRKN